MEEEEEDLNPLKGIRSEEDNASCITRKSETNIVQCSKQLELPKLAATHTPIASTSIMSASRRRHVKGKLRSQPPSLSDIFKYAPFL